LLVACVLAVVVGIVFRRGARARTVPGADSRSSARGTPKTPAWMRGSLRVIRTLALAVVALILVACLLENRLVYYPMRYPSGDWDAGGLTVEDCFFDTEDGLTLHAWWQQGEAAEGGPVMLWFHGNAGNLTHRADNLRMLSSCRLSVLIVDYRGFGKSEGRPSEKGLYLDGDAAYRYLTQQRKIDPGRIVCFGRSLGAAVALDVALRHPVSGLILESPFASARAMARKMMPVIPLWLFIRSRFDNLGRVGGLGASLLVIHGDRDEIVPFEQGVAVFDAAPEPKEFYRLRGAGHNDTYAVGDRPYTRRLEEFCLRCTQTDD